MGLLILLLQMLWQQLLWSIYNSQISETLDNKQIAPPHSFPCLELWRGGVSVPGTQATSGYYWSLT